MGTTPLLRMMTCGSVDDGKSTLIGRLLLDTGRVPHDQLAGMTRNGELDPSLLFDGLSAEREQGITIDVAHRHLDLDGRRILLADTPGHEQYTRNTITAASVADAAVILVDARHGATTQTRRHLRLIEMLGVRHIAVAINKMDLVGHDRRIFDQIRSSLEATTPTTCIPVVATTGENVSRPSPHMGWWDGPTVRDWIAGLDPDDDRSTRPLRMWVQRVEVLDGERLLMGRISSGTMTVGDDVVIAPSGRRATIASLTPVDSDGRAGPGRSVTVTLDRHLDCARGDLLGHPESPPVTADRFRVDLIWVGDRPMIPGRRYAVIVGTSTVIGTFAKPLHLVDIDDGSHRPADVLAVNDIGSCDLSLDRSVSVDTYEEDPSTGGFVVVDRDTAETVGLCLVRLPMRRSPNVTRQATRVDRELRERLTGHRGAVVWMSGLSGAGKSTIADALEVELHSRGVRTFVLDGDNLRHGLNSDLGFSDADRVENIRRTAEVAALMAESGTVCICALISPFAAEREFARTRLEPGRFFEIHVDVPLDVAESRDPKGLYAKARAGELIDFTGIDSPYEPPRSPDLHIETATTSVEEAVERLVDLLRTHGIV